MRAVVCSELAGLDGLELRDDHPPPEPQQGEVLIDVHAAGINFPDLLVTQGLYQFKARPPFVPGGEGAGVVAAVGAGVEGVAAGDEVTFGGIVGAFAEQAVANANWVFAKPPGMSWVDAAAFTFGHGTSWHALKQRGRLAPGETLLVLGAAGGVGTAAVQLGKAMGATVIAAASTPEKLAFAVENGADATIDYTREDLRERLRELTAHGTVDVVYDPVGGAFTEPALRSTGWRGRYLIVGFTAGDIPRIPANLPLLKGSSIVGVFWGAWLEREGAEVAENQRELAAMYAAGSIAPRVMESHDLADFETALRLVSERKVLGKLVLEIR